MTYQIPFFDYKHEIKGCQIIKVCRPNSRDFNFKIIGLYDQDQNNVYTLKTQYLQFGYQYFFNN